MNNYKCLFFFAEIMFKMMLIKKITVIAQFFYYRMVGDIDLNVFIFDEFGKNFPKSQKLSPDSFIQNAIQLAYYRYDIEDICFFW